MAPKLQQLARGCRLLSSRCLSSSREARRSWRRSGRRTARPTEATSLQPGGVDFGMGSSGRSGRASWVGGGGSSSVGSGKQLGSLARLQQQLKALGLAGVLAYGLFNTLYYSCAFLFIWIYVARVPAGAGAVAAAQSFLQVFAITWAGSQVSKVPRAAGALLLAPAVDRGMGILELKLKLRSRQQAFLLVVGCCLVLVLLLFCGVVVVWS